MFWPSLKALRQLEDRVERLERESKALETEWTEVYDKIRHTLSRLAKRSERAIQTEPEAPQTNGPGLGPVDPISQQILARRRRLGVREGS